MGKLLGANQCASYCESCGRGNTRECLGIVENGYQNEGNLLTLGKRLGTSVKSANAYFYIFKPEAFKH